MGACPISMFVHIHKSWQPMSHVIEVVSWICKNISSNLLTLYSTDNSLILNHVKRSIMKQRRKKKKEEKWVKMVVRKSRTVWSLRLVHFSPAGGALSARPRLPVGTKTCFVTQSVRTSSLNVRQSILTYTRLYANTRTPALYITTRFESRVHSSKLPFSRASYQ